MQLTSVPSILKEVDVDQECLVSLEEEMFKNTDRTRVLGNGQWGLDRGYHQGGWDPSFGVPASWNRKVRMGNKSKCKVRPNYPTKTFAHSSSSDRITSTLQNQPQPQNPMQGPDCSHMQKIRRKEVIRQLNSFRNLVLLTPNSTFLYKNGFHTQVKIEINECLKI